jgi:hypothetical protein
MNPVAVFLAAHISAAAGMPLKKHWAKSIIKWATLRFWGVVWGTRLGKRRTPYGIQRRPPLPPKRP